MKRVSIGLAPISVSVAVIVTTYNKPIQQIVECFQSLRDQTVKPKEVFLIDDHSKNPRPHADAVSIFLPKNVGVARARDVGVKMSTSKLLLFLDGDDKLAPNFLEESILTITKCDIAYPDMVLFGEVPINRMVKNPSSLSAKNLLNLSCSIPVTSLMKREVYESLGGFDSSLPIFEDWEFWIRAMCNGYSFKRANTYLWYRQNPKSRNHQTLEYKTKIYNQFTKNYTIKENKICKVEQK